MLKCVRALPLSSSIHRVATITLNAYAASFALAAVAAVSGGATTESGELGGIPSGRFNRIFDLRAASVRARFATAERLLRTLWGAPPRLRTISGV